MAGDNSDDGWAGAMLVADALDDLKFCRLFLVGVAKGAATKTKKKR